MEKQIIILIGLIAVLILGYFAEQKGWLSSIPEEPQQLQQPEQAVEPEQPPGSEQLSQEITNFEECLSAGYQIQESHPRQCQTPDGKIFVEKIEEANSCALDEECIPATCCHPKECIPINEALDCSNIFCTDECRPGTMDCGQGKCVCLNGQCQVSWLKQLECNGMSIEEASRIAKASECGERLIGGTQICNENTNTWWIDLDIEKQGCSPACVINTITKKAEINWRCTGLTTPE